MMKKKLPDAAPESTNGFAKTSTKKPLNTIIRRWLFAVAATALIISILIVGYFIKLSAIRNVNNLLLLNVTDVKEDIINASDENLLAITEEIASTLNSRESSLSSPLFVRLAKDAMQSAGFSSGEISRMLEEDPLQFMTEYIAVSRDVPEVSIINPEGIIIASTEDSFVGFDMASGEQSAEFLCLLTDGTHSFVQKYMPITYNDKISMKYAGVRLRGGGFVQVGYDAARFQKDISDRVKIAAVHRHVGKTGSVLIVNEKGMVISSPVSRLRGHSLGEFGVSTLKLRDHVNEVPFEDVMSGTEYNILGTSIEGYYIFGMVPKAETLKDVYTACIATSVVIAVLLAVVTRLIYLLIRKFVVKSVDEIAVSLDQIAGGNLDVVVDPHSTQEFDSLSKSINTTVGALRSMAEKEAARFETELEYAKNIQRSSLPNLFPPFPDRHEFDIYSTMNPAREVGGDFFDFELIDQHRLALCVADVSGKGIPAALFMMRAKTLIRDYCIAGHSPDQVLEKVNAELCINNDANMFVTCWFGILDTDTGVIDYANAGHNPPLLRTGSQDFTYLRAYRPGFVLAGMEGIRYKKYELRLQPGDELFVYTDGVTEATDSNKQLYGEDRLLAAINRFSAKSCEEKCHEIRIDIDHFVGSAPQFDDITMLSLRYNGRTDT